MNITTGIQSDILHPKSGHGAYEWWYFDGMDTQQELAWVLIFYEGNPFSPWYLSDEQARAEDYPAATLSIYHQGKPIYYSFVEFEPEQVSFSSNRPQWKMRDHIMTFEEKGNRWNYTLHIRDRLPSGDALMADFTYSSPAFNDELQSGNDHSNVDHRWTLVQPRAEVSGKINITNALRQKKQEWEINGLGYHDHNIGYEPMREEFYDWYWGRLHFDSATLLYYIMHRESTEQYQGWLISNHDGKIIDRLQDITLDDISGNRFMLASARKLKLEFDHHEALIQQRPMVDSGPFYQRFLASGILSKAGKRPEPSQGISEYIRPGRIDNKLFHPLVKMRLLSEQRGVHWVQKSPRLYRWTW